MTTAPEQPPAPSTHSGRRLRDVLRTDSQWRRAASEFALIVLGVLVALGVNNWNTQRGRDRTAAVFLSSIRSALASDLVLLQEADSGYREREQRIVGLIDHLRRGRSYDDSLRRSFGAVFGLWDVAVNRAPYEALKATDLSLVASDSLRGELADLYERTYAALDGAGATDVNALFEVLRPYFLRSFKDIRFRESATPLHPEAVMRDPYFLNIIEYRLAVLRANQLEETANAITRVQATLRRLDAALSQPR